MTETILLASDHGGFALKEQLKTYLSDKGFKVADLGTHNTDRTDFPLYAQKVAASIKAGEAARAILVCGSGQGMAMTANRFSHIRAALCWDVSSAKLARNHNDANVLCLGGRLIGPITAQEIVDAFLTTAFEGGRYAKRIEMMG